jgi:hypothetical protein
MLVVIIVIKDTAKSTNHRYASLAFDQKKKGIKIKAGQKRYK